VNGELWNGFHVAPFSAILLAPLLVAFVAPAMLRLVSKTFRAFSIESSVSLYGRNPLSDLDGFRGIVWSGDAALSISALRNQTALMQGTHKERPLTHDLLARVLRALGAKIDRLVVNDVKDGTYFARLVLSAENETQQKKIIEIDARPSDCIAMATQQLAPIFVSLDVWDEVEDMTEVLRKLQQKGPDMEQGDEGEE
jgi:bifunctional DNase/RNase